MRNSVWEVSPVVYRKSLHAREGILLTAVFISDEFITLRSELERLNKIRKVLLYLSLNQAVH